MKKIFVILFVLALACSAHALDNPWNMKLPFKNAKIDYQLSGTMKGKKTLYIKDYGKTRAEYTETAMEIFGMRQEQKDLIITTPDWIYTINLLKKTGTRHVNMRKLMKQEFDKLSKKEKKKILTSNDGGIKKNAASILGYKCDQVKASGTTSYTISGTDVVMKITGNTMGIEFSQTAIALKKKKASSSLFKVPDGISVEHDEQTDNMMRQQAKEMIQALKEGKQPDAMSGTSSNVKKRKGQKNNTQKDEKPSMDDLPKGMKDMFEGLF